MLGHWGGGVRTAIPIFGERTRAGWVQPIVGELET